MEGLKVTDWWMDDGKDQRCFRKYIVTFCQSGWETIETMVVTSR